MHTKTNSLKEIIYYKKTLKVLCDEMQHPEMNET